MNLAHVHLLLNHFPTVGMVVGTGLFLLGLISKSLDLKRASLVVFVLIALIAMPTYMSGNAAMERIQNNEGYNQAVVNAHQSWALLGFIILEVVGLFAWLGLWQYRRNGSYASWTLPTVAVLALVALAVMSNAANIGGEIMHPEIVGEAGPTEAAIGPLNGETLGPAITESTWIWAMGETIHFIGLSILFGVVLAIDLRVLGVIRNISFQALHKLLPWAVGAFAVNTVTGMVFFLGAYSQYTANDVFHWKLALIVLAGANALYFTTLDETWSIQAGDEAPVRAKLVAVSAVVLWLGVVYAGRMLPFLGGAF